MGFAQWIHPIVVEEEGTSRQEPNSSTVRLARPSKQLPRAASPPFFNGFRIYSTHTHVFNFSYWFSLSLSLLRQSGRNHGRGLWRGCPHCLRRRRWGKASRVPVLGFQFHFGPESAHCRRQRVMTPLTILIFMNSLFKTICTKTDGDRKYLVVKWWYILLSRRTVLQTAGGFHEPVPSTKIFHFSVYSTSDVFQKIIYILYNISIFFI